MDYRHSTSRRSKASKNNKNSGLNSKDVSVVTPYHKARSGFLYKMPIHPSSHRTGRYSVPLSECVGFTAENRVKLSYHTDGFVQFSGEAPGQIMSGLDPATGEPKGRALNTQSLAAPIWSGPSVTVTIWGIDEFEETKEGDEPLVFEPSEFYYRGCTPDEANGWILLIYVFPMHVMPPPVRFQQGCARLEVTLEGLSGHMTSVVQQKVIDLREERVFLGLFVSRVMTDFPSRSGWTLNGPGDFTRERKGHVLMGIYPREAIDVLGRDSLDRFPSVAQKGEPAE